MRLILLSFMATLLLAACGRKGELEPPPGYQAPPTAQDTSG
ncbi:MAG: LPS translocon maturation chaperone LptM [Pseudomonadota bacterium]